MLSSGITAVATAGAGNTVLLAANTAESVQSVGVLNEGPVAGFASIDGGTTWMRIPAASAATSPVCVIIPLRNGFKLTAGLLVKRDGGTNMTGVWGFAV